MNNTIALSTRPLRKFGMILLVLAAPLVLAVIFLYPMIVISNLVKYVEHYQLPKGFNKANIEAAVKQMRQDTEYQFYFKALGPERIQQATENVYQVLNANRSRGQHLAQIRSMKDRVQSTATLLNSLEFPEGFSKNPLAYEDIVRKFWDFVEDEFQLTILGLCYKSTYDRGFQFHWSLAAKQAAQKWERIFAGFSEEQRKEIQERLKPK